MAQNQIRGGQVRSGTIANDQIASNAEIALSKIAGGVSLDNRVIALEDWTNLINVREIPSGSINGSNVTFTLSKTPVAGSEQVYLNGLIQDPGAGNSYTISGAVITFLSAPLSGDEIHVTYASGDYMVAPAAPAASSSAAGIDYGSVLSGDSNGVGNQYTVAIRDDNTLFAWGNNFSGNLGLGDTVNRYGPIKVGSSSDWSKVQPSMVKAEDGAAQHTVAIKTNGTLWAWGANTNGQIGDGTLNQRLTPVQIGSDTSWDKISCGVLHTVAIKTNGTLWAWGSNSNGQLGDGTTTQRTSPVQIGNGTNWSKIAASYHTVALKSDGTLWAWGTNTYGQVGNGTTTNRTTGPLQIGSSTWNQISVGYIHTVAIRSDGTLWAWGANDYGQLGDGTTTQRTSPVQVGSANNWSKVWAGNRHTIALKTDGTLWAWGMNTYRQLGDGTSTQRNSPVQVGTSSDWIDARAGGANSIAIKSDGTMFIWGLNDYGQLGDGTNLSRYSPKKSEVDFNF